jgi:hypothetical protein
VANSGCPVNKRSTRRSPARRRDRRRGIRLCRRCMPDRDVLDSIADAKSLIRSKIQEPQEAGTPVSLNGPPGSASRVVLCEWLRTGRRSVASRESSTTSITHQRERYERTSRVLAKDNNAYGSRDRGATCVVSAGDPRRPAVGLSSQRRRFLYAALSFNRNFLSQRANRGAWRARQFRTAQPSALEHRESPSATDANLHRQASHLSAGFKDTKLTDEHRNVQG